MLPWRRGKRPVIDRAAARRAVHRAQVRPPLVRRVTRSSDALDRRAACSPGGSEAHRRLAQALGRAQQAPQADPYRSALSMLTFYLNRAGKSLPAARRRTLQRAEGELRKQFGRD